MEPIQSTKNPLVRRFRDAAAAAGADRSWTVAEGSRLVGEALDSGQVIVEAAWSPRLLTRPGGLALRSRLDERAELVSACTDKVLQRLSQLETHQGVSVILRRPSWTTADLLGRGGVAPLVVVAAGIQDPGNLGALLRSAEAASATGLLALDGSADPFRSKALRGSAGSAFRLPCHWGATACEAVEFLRAHRLRILVAAGSGDTSCWETDLRLPTALVFGAEGSGLPPILAAAADGRVSIPLMDPVESLNVAVAAGVLLFEARRQRR